jgi:hypothetical protein
MATTPPKADDIFEYVPVLPRVIRRSSPVVYR